MVPVIHILNRFFHRAIFRLAGPLVLLAGIAFGEPWPRHIIDDSSRGADGVRLADVNGDGFADIATAWEEGGVVRVYLNPGPLRAKRRWPAVTVGRVSSPEDAVFADVDGNGTTDVVSSCEGEDQTIYVHWAPRYREDYLDPEKWRTEAIAASRGLTQWMFALPFEVDFRRGVDLIAGAKGKGAKIGWFESPPDPRDLGAWIWHAVYSAGWTMSLINSDMDGDGDRDVLVSDRKGPGSGTLWLENPGPGEELTRIWPERRIGADGEEVMFVAEADLDEDGLIDVLSAVRPRTVSFHRRLARDGRKWLTQSFPLSEKTGTAKAVGVGDLDGDRRRDVVVSCESAASGGSGVGFYTYIGSFSDWKWVYTDISGPDGVKFDRIELLDLDGDGDLDVLTSEEITNLGVVWYENPTR
jgi:hypothetical protein